MPEKQLPVRSNLEQYKKQAKELARACRDNLADALERIRAFRKELPADWKFDRDEASAR